jgi:hypothetical protein
MAPEQLTDAPLEAEDVKEMFSELTGAMEKVFQEQVMEIEYDEDKPLVDAALQNTNLFQPMFILMKHVRGLVSLKEPDDGVEFVKGSLEGTHPRASLMYLRMICEYINKSQDPPRDVPETFPVCGLMGRTFYDQPINDYWFAPSHARKELDNAGFTEENLFQYRNLDTSQPSG